jgi:hypothetical protein
VPIEEEEEEFVSSVSQQLPRQLFVCLTASTTKNCVNIKTLLDTAGRVGHLLLATEMETQAAFE